MSFPVTEHIAKSARHTTFYLACGGAHRPAVIFVHGWPELSISWRHQLETWPRHPFPRCGINRILSAG
jgi:pimeloyl-ACP methyl ester carboxylesterase